MKTLWLFALLLAVGLAQVPLVAHASDDVGCQTCGSSSDDDSDKEDDLWSDKQDDENAAAEDDANTAASIDDATSSDSSDAAPAESSSDSNSSQ